MDPMASNLKELIVVVAGFIAVAFLLDTFKTESTLVAETLTRPNHHLMKDVRGMTRRSVTSLHVASGAPEPRESENDSVHEERRNPSIVLTAGLWWTGAVASLGAVFGALWKGHTKPENDASQGLVSRRLFEAGVVTVGSALPAWASALVTPAAVPVASLGSLQVSRIIQGHGKEPLEDPSANMRNHFAAGITTFDTADIYGPSQELIGQYLRSEKPAGAVVCTKFCCFNNLENIGRDAVRRSIERSLNKLRVKQLDLVAFFWSDWRVKNYVQTALYLKELKDEGLIKEIGVTNFDVAHLRELVDAGVPVVSNQVQYSLMDRRPENGMVQYCAQQGIKIIAFGTVCGGYLSSKYLGVRRPPPVSNYSESLYSTSIFKAGGWGYLQEVLQTLDGVAQRHGVTIANVAQRWVLQQPEVAAIIIGVRNSNHIQENVNTFSFELDSQDLADIAQVLLKEAPPVGDIWDRERGLV